MTPSDSTAHPATTETAPLVDVADLVGRTALEARPYQMRLMQKALAAFLGKRMRSVMIESPTGSGKTATSLCIIKGLQRVHPGLRVAWFSMRRNLLAQAERENVQKAIGAGVDFISMFDKHVPPEFIVGSGVTAARRMIVVDECQHDAANTMASLHSRIQADFILGMTATPFRTDRVKLCFDAVLKDAGLASLIREGYLSQYRHFTIPRWSVREVCDHYLRSPGKWGQSLIYFHRIQECHQAAAIIEAHGVAVDVVTASSDRATQIDRFTAGETRVLVNCMVLTEGFDSPALETVFCRPSCKGVTIQMAGRAFRKHPLAADPRYALKNIVQAKKGWPLLKLAVPLEQYVWKHNEDDDGGWLSLVVNPHINTLCCRMLETLAASRTELPAYITQARLKQRGRGRRRRI